MCKVKECCCYIIEYSIEKKLQNLRICIDLPVYVAGIIDNLMILIFDLLTLGSVHAEHLPCEYMSTDFGVDSSSHFSAYASSTVVGKECRIMVCDVSIKKPLCSTHAPVTLVVVQVGLG